MTMRRISMLLVGVVVAVMLSMGTALAHQSNNHKVCHVQRGDDVTLRLSHKKANKHINNHNRDYRGECDNDGNRNIGERIAKFATNPF